MKKVLLILLISSIFNITVNAEDTGREAYPRFTFGLEWGYVASIHQGYHYYYFAPEGFRVDEIGDSFRYVSNADMYVNIGWNIDKHWNLALYLGYAGAGNLHNVVPVSLRGTRYFGSDPLADRWFAFLDLGSGIGAKIPVQEILAGKAGGGYRLSLSRDSKLDLLFSARIIYTHPSIYRDDIRIPKDNIDRNNAWISAISVGMAVTF